MRCPFCAYSHYDYRTVRGLWRHIQIYHITRRYSNSGEEECLVVAIDGHIEYIKLTKEDMKDLEDFIHDYWKGRFEPSKRSSRWWSYVRRDREGT